MAGKILKKFAENGKDYSLNGPGIDPQIPVLSHLNNPALRWWWSQSSQLVFAGGASKNATRVEMKL